MKILPPLDRLFSAKAACLSFSILAASVAFAPSAKAASGTWTSPSSGNWSDSGNWSGGTIADGAGSAANFNGLDLGTDVTVHLDSLRSIGSLTFSDLGSSPFNSYILDNGGNSANVLTLDTGTTAAAVITVATGNTATISLNLAGTTGLTKANSNGTLILTGNNTYSGVTTISGGSSGFIQVNSNAAFGNSTLSVSSSNGGIRYGAAFNDLRDIAFGPNGGRLDTNGFDVTYSSTMTGEIVAGSAFTKTGLGTLTLAGTNNITGAGAINIIQGFVKIDSDARLGGSTGGIILNGNNASGIRYGAAFNNLRAISLGTSGGAIDTNGFDVTYSSTISSVGVTNGTLTKLGAGVLKLTGANAYTGQTVVSAGTLLVNGSTAGGAVTVNAAATLGGTGVVGGATAVSGILSPGDGVGTLAFGNNLTVNSSGSYAFQGGDLVTVAGTLTLNNNWTMSLGSGLMDGGSIAIFTFGSLAGSSDLTPIFDLSQLGFTPTGPLSLTQVGNTLVLNGVQAIPEPSTYALLILGFGVAFWMQRLRRRTATI